MTSKNSTPEEAEELDGDVQLELVLTFASLNRKTTLQTVLPFLKNQQLTICVSGGAQGADACWAKSAVTLTKFHMSLNMSFEKHSPVLCESTRSKNVVLSTSELAEADKLLQEANKYLKRRWDNDLLRRNYYQIRYSTSVYAVGIFQESAPKTRNHVNINGGTAWACQMFVHKTICETAKATSRAVYSIPLYFFDQNTCGWFQARICVDGQQLQYVEWKSIAVPPAPTGIYTGIGTRELSAAGTKAITELLKTTGLM